MKWNHKDLQEINKKDLKEKTTRTLKKEEETKVLKKWISKCLEMKMNFITIEDFLLSNLKTQIKTVINKMKWNLKDLQEINKMDLKDKTTKTLKKEEETKVLNK